MSKSIRITIVIYLLIAGFNELKAQILGDLVPRSQSTPADSLLNMDANYNRPTIQLGRSPINIGGYLEANSIYKIDEGETEGLGFEFRRMSLVLATPIGKRLSFLSELEFENQGKELSVEYAALDVNIFTELNFRGGLVLNPIGSFNQNHDGPQWEFVERPMQASKLLPATFRNVGFGAFGKFHKKDWIIGYEAYITNGFNALIINNPERRTYLPATKGKPLSRVSNSLGNSQDDDFVNYSGKALLSGKLAIKNRKLGEVGISYMGGVYNKIADDEGLELDSKNRRVDVVALDLSTAIKKTDTKIRAEFAYIWVGVPKSYSPVYGNQQLGTFVDIVQPILKRKVLGWEDASLNLAVRFEYVDYNIGKFKETGESIGDEVFAITPAISFRPMPQTVFRINYEYKWRRDELRNPFERSAAWYFGFSTYF